MISSGIERAKLSKQLEQYAPCTDINAWNKYPKYNWVYETTRLLDSQNVYWAPYPFEQSMCSLPIWAFDHSISPLPINFSTCLCTDRVYIAHDLTTNVISCTFLVLYKGSMVCQETYKYGEFLDKYKHNNLDQEKVKDLNAFLGKYFKRYSGLMTLYHANNIYYKISLKANKDDIFDLTELSVAKNIIQLYSKSKWN